MTGPLSDHEEVEVGGDLDADRLRAIMVRGFLFRNVAISPAEAFTYRSTVTYPGMVDGVPPWSAFGGSQHTDGETPTLVWDSGDGGETRMPGHEVHVGCGEICPVFAVVPWDGDMGGVPSGNARAIAHAGRDLIDIVREVVMLRSAIVMKAADPDTVLLVDMPTAVDRETAQRMLHSLIQATGCSALGMTLPSVPLPRGDVEKSLELLSATMTDAAAANQLRATLEPILEAVAHLWRPDVKAHAARLRTLLDIAIPDSGLPVAGDGST